MPMLWWQNFKRKEDKMEYNTGFALAMIVIVIAAFILGVFFGYLRCDREHEFGEKEKDKEKQ